MRRRSARGDHPCEGSTGETWLRLAAELKEAAASKVDDMTNHGLAQLAVKAGLENFQAREQQADIDSVGQCGTGSGLLTSLLPAEWVSVELASYSPCYGHILRRKSSRYHCSKQSNLYVNTGVGTWTALASTPWPHCSSIT